MLKEFLCYDIRTGDNFARDIKRIGIGASLTVVALLEPSSDSNIKDRAMGIMRKHDVSESALQEE